MLAVRGYLHAPPAPVGVGHQLADTAELAAAFLALCPQRVALLVFGCVVLVQVCCLAEDFVTQPTLEQLQGRDHDFRVQIDSRVLHTSTTLRFLDDYNRLLWIQRLYVSIFPTQSH